MRPVCVDTEWLQKILTENPGLVESFRAYHGCSIEECVEIERKMYLELKRQFEGKNCSEE